MTEEDSPLAPQGEAKPFFAIDANELSAVKEAHGAPPAAIEVGNFGQNLSTPSTTGDGSAVAPTPQLTGAVMTSAGQQVFATPPVVQKERFQWKQFFIGLSIPVVVVVLFGSLENAFYDGYQEEMRREQVVVSSEDNKTFELQFEPRETEIVHSFSSDFEYDGYMFHIETWMNYSGEDLSPSWIYQYNDIPDEDWATIGSHDPYGLNTSFTLENASVQELSITVRYWDEALEEANAESMVLFDVACCLLPFAYITGIIGSFATGRKALGIGMLSAALIPILSFVFFVTALSVVP